MRSLSIPFASIALVATACGGPGADSPGRTPLADKWFSRAKQSYRVGDFEDARTAGAEALKLAQRDQSVAIVNARIALASLDYARVLQLTEPVRTAEAQGLRGRAYWYSGDMDSAADELEAMLQNPEVKDPWAREVAKLARRGQGRHPFAIEGAIVTAVEMPRAGPALVVPCELEGESILALASTAVGEVILDSGTRKEPAWVNLRFGGITEVRDVPALTQDLSGLSRQFGAPIKALLGVNLLRHLHVTFDRRGDQFVVRKNDPPAPPEASKIPVWYVRGGGMLVRAELAKKPESSTTLLVDTSTMYPLALEEAAWRKTGVNLATLRTDPNLPAGVKTGVLPVFRLGAFDLPDVPAMHGAALGDTLAEIGRRDELEVGGVIGAGFMQLFRVTLADGGRYLWAEPDPGLSATPEPGPGRKGPTK